MTEPTLKMKVAERFGKAAGIYNQHNILQQKTNLMLQPFVRDADMLLDLGCGPGPAYSLLRPKCKHYIGVDLSNEMLEEARLHYLDHWVQGDAESLPLRSGSVDLVYSNLALQWCESPRTACHELYRVLKPGGRVVSSVVLDKSMQPLQQFMHKSGASACINQQLSLSSWEECFEGAGLTIHQRAEQSVTAWFPTLKSLFDSIRGVGAGHLTSVAGGRLTRKGYRQLSDLYETARSHGELPLSYHIGIIVAEKPIPRT